MFILLGMRSDCLQKETLTIDYSDYPLKFSTSYLGRVISFTGRHKPIPGGLTVAVQATDTRETSNPTPRSTAIDNFHLPTTVEARPSSFIVLAED